MHALVGANGAGKSTLGKIIGGVIRPDDGQMFVDDRPVRYASPREARIDGIATISQELSPMPHMSVIENIFFGIEPRRSGWCSGTRCAAQYEELVAPVGLPARRQRQGRRVAHRRQAEGRDPARGRVRCARDRDGRANLVADQRRDRHAAPDDRRPARARQDDRLREPLPRRGARPRRHGDGAAQRAPRPDGAGGGGDRGEPRRRDVRCRRGGGALREAEALDGTGGP